MSIAGGLTKALDLGVKFGCDCIQIFLKNQRQWKGKPLAESEVRGWWQARARSGLEPIVAHDNYLVNLASPDTRLWKKSYDTFRDEIDRCELLGIDYLVVHPGSHLGHGEPEGIARIIKALDRLTDEKPALRTRTLLELTSGQGSNLGYDFAQLEEILSRAAKPDFFGICLDTCHAFAAGYDLRTPEAVGRTIDELDRVIGLDRLHVIHVNDSKKPLGSRVDRHEHLGHGLIGLAGLRAVVCEPRLEHLPMILETPKEANAETGEDWDAINLRTLRSLSGGAARAVTHAPTIE